MKSINMTDSNPPEIDPEEERRKQAMKDELDLYAQQQIPKTPRSEAPSATVDMQSEDDQALTDAVAAYNKLCLNQDGTYKDGYEAPEVNEDGSISFKFPSEEEAVDFFSDRAKKGEKFMILDASTNEMLAFSNGDGNLRRPPEPNGEVIKQGELFNPPKQDDDLSASQVTL